jgi:hypothetical protein
MQTYFKNLIFWQLSNRYNVDYLQQSCKLSIYTNTDADILQDSSINWMTRAQNKGYFCDYQCGLMLAAVYK